MARVETASTQSGAIERESARGEGVRASSGGGGFGVRLGGGIAMAHRLPDTKFLFAITLRDAYVVCLIFSQLHFVAFELLLPLSLALLTHFAYLSLFISRQPRRSHLDSSSFHLATFPAIHNGAY